MNRMRLPGANKKMLGMVWWFVISFMSSTLFAWAQDKNEETNLTTVDHGQRLVDWVRSKGGFVSPKVEIRKMDPTDPKSSYGMFAKQNIAKSERILSIPRTCLLSTSEEDSCDTVELLAQEMQLGKESQYEPYITYLLETQPYGQLPSLWSDAGKRLLRSIVRETFEDSTSKQVLPPSKLLNTEWIGCELFEETTPLMDRHAAMLVHQRGWDEVMIPILDMLNHRNGHRWLNTRESHSVHDRSHPVLVEASRAIRVGDEVYSSYSSCLDCGGRNRSYGTPEILRDYGFVETMRQQWVFSKQELVFALDFKDDVKDGFAPDENNLALRWLTDKRPNDDHLEFFQHQIDRLSKLGETALTARDPEVPDNEWNTIVDYHRSLLLAMQMLVNEVKQEEACLRGEIGTCTVTDARYDDLAQMWDDEDYSSYVCDIDWTFPTYNSLDRIKSQYQEIYFIEHPEHHDVCFELDTTWQICGSYRPHYHELGTHYPASFLPELKRVLWVGGGDSMLLHEILKYTTSLELAIGLELDQKVTRNSFRYFGTQPHWDKYNKVQWWFGDAAKSLLMLPKEYFGTFDLILVDLSETVMSNSVTNELDIMAALSLLLKPDGIFMKNEIYLDQLSELFTHAMHLHAFDVPILCSQSFIYGSNSINFLKQNLTNHGLENNLFYKPFGKDDDRFFEVHDYVYNANPKRHCTDEKTEQPPIAQQSSPGVVLILEAEDADSKVLSSTNEMLKVMMAVLVSENGLSVVSTFATSLTDGSSSMVTLVLKEGYVIARVWPTHKYCAFDIHMWSSFLKLDTIKNSFLAAMGSTGAKSSSAFRIVAGGMFGISTWKEDSMSLGPRLPPCEHIEYTEVRDTPMDDSLVQTIVKENLELLPDDNAVAAVVCGPEDGPTACSSIDTASKHPSIGRVVPLWTCSSIAGGVEYQQDSANLKFDCEKSVVQILEELGKADVKVGALILDPSAEYAMAQVLHRVVSRAKSRRERFEDKLLVLAPMVDGEEDWRRVFVDLFRQLHDHIPMFRSAVLYNTTESSMEMGTFLAGDSTFIARIHQVTQKLEESTNLVGQSLAFEEGDFPLLNDPVPGLFTLPTDYDQSGPYEQWQSQKPLGHQTVFQVVGQTSALSKDNVRESLESVLKAMKMLTSKDIREFRDLGEGSALFIQGTKGSIAILWDGRKSITINLFTYTESENFATQFVNAFVSTNKSLKLMLRDEMPRGYGRVVNFAKDLTKRATDQPSGAMGLEKASVK